MHVSMCNLGGKGLLPVDLGGGLPGLQQILESLLPLFMTEPSKRVKVKVAQSRLTLCDPMDYPVHGILQARILEWVAFPFSRDLPNPGLEPRSLTLQADSLPTEPPGKSKRVGES